MASSNDNAHPHDVSLPSLSRGVYWDLVEKIKIALTAESKYEDIFSVHDLRWEQLYLLPRKATLDSKTREFQYKLLHRIIYTNKILHKMGLVVGTVTYVFLLWKYGGISRAFVYLLRYLKTFLVIIA